MKNVSNNPIICLDCGVLENRTSNRQLRCIRCQINKDKLHCKDHHKRTYVKKGYTLKGIQHNQYKNGIGMYKKSIKKVCEFCDVAITNLCVHHIDEDRKNNKEDNLATLCRSCHILVHGAIDRKDLLGRFTKKETTNGY